MSRNTRLVLTAVAALAAVGCVDAKSSFEDFAERVTDGAPLADRLGLVADISGEHMLVVTGGTPLGSNRLNLIATVTNFEENPDGSASADFEFQPLAVADKEEVGNALVATDVAISTAGQFAVDIVGTIVGAANPISGQRIVADITLAGAIQSEDFWCGDVTGTVNAGAQITLQETTFAASRIEAGTRGAALPTDLPGACETTPPIDAGFDAPPT